MDYLAHIKQMAMLVSLENDNTVYEVQLTKLAKELLLQAAADLSPNKQICIAPNPNIQLMTGPNNRQHGSIELLSDWKPKEDFNEEDG